MRLVAHGPAGHGSRPTIGNAVVHLAAAVARAGTWQTPMRLNETTREYFQRLAPIGARRQQAARYRALLDPARAAGGRPLLPRRTSPGTTRSCAPVVVPTIVNGGFRANVIPSEGGGDAGRARAARRGHAEVRRGAAACDRRSGGGGDSAEDERASGRPRRRGIDTEMFRALERSGRRMFAVPTLPT